MKNLFERILNSESPTSSRRFTAMIGLTLFSACVITILSGVNVDTELLYITGGFVLTCLGLSTFGKK